MHGEQMGFPLQPSHCTPAAVSFPSFLETTDDLSQKPAKTVTIPACSVDSSWVGLHDDGGDLDLAFLSFPVKSSRDGDLAPDWT